MKSAIKERKMEKRYKDLIKQISQISEDGIFGTNVKAELDKYSNIADEFSVLLFVLDDFHKQGNLVEKELSVFRDYFFQTFIVLYRETTKYNPEIAEAFAHSFIQDFGDVSQSTLFSRWYSLTKASIAYKEAIRSNDFLCIWEQALRTFLAYNEFLDGLIGYLTISWQCTIKTDYDDRIFQLTYKDKADKLFKLTNGETGAFYMFHRIIKPVIKEAIEKGNVRIEKGSGKIHYNNEMPASSIDIQDFLTLNLIGTHLGSCYLAAISAITVWRSGKKELLSDNLVKLFEV